MEHPLTNLANHLYPRAKELREKLHAFYEPHTDLAMMLDTGMRTVRYHKAEGRPLPRSAVERLQRAVWNAEDLLRKQSTPAAVKERVSNAIYLAAQLRANLCSGVSPGLARAEIFGKLDRLDAELAALLKGV